MTTVVDVPGDSRLRGFGRSRGGGMPHRTVVKEERVWSGVSLIPPGISWSPPALRTALANCRPRLGT